MFLNSTHQEKKDVQEFQDEDYVKMTINKSITQVERCKWLMKLKRTLNYKFFFDS